MKCAAEHLLPLFKWSICLKLALRRPLGCGIYLFFLSLRGRVRSIVSILDRNNNKISKFSPDLQNNFKCLFKGVTSEREVQVAIVANRIEQSFYSVFSQETSTRGTPIEKPRNTPNASVLRKPRASWLKRTLLSCVSSLNTNRSSSVLIFLYISNKHATNWANSLLNLLLFKLMFVLLKRVVLVRKLFRQIPTNRDLVLIVSIYW